MLLDLHAKECHFPPGLVRTHDSPLTFLSPPKVNQLVCLDISQSWLNLSSILVFLCSNSSLKCSVLSHVLSRHKFATNTSILLYIYQQIKFLVSLVCHRQSENYLCLHPPTHTKINKLVPDTESPTCLKKKKENKKLSEPAVVFANSILSLL